eukprot:5221081-Amphidinium_carterae.1
MALSIKTSWFSLRLPASGSFKRKSACASKSTLQAKPVLISYDWSQATLMKGSQQTEKCSDQILTRCIRDRGQDFFHCAHAIEAVYCT